jgi:hypothetical protein
VWRNQFSVINFLLGLACPPQKIDYPHCGEEDLLRPPSIVERRTLRKHQVLSNAEN